MPTWLRIVFFLLLPVLVWYFVSEHGVPTWLLILFYISLPGFIWGIVSGFVPSFLRGLAKGRKSRRA